MKINSSNERKSAHIMTLIKIMNEMRVNNRHYAMSVRVGNWSRHCEILSPKDTGFIDNEKDELGNELVHIGIFIKKTTPEAIWERIYYRSGSINKGKPSEPQNQSLELMLTKLEHDLVMSGVSQMRITYESMQTS